MKNRESKFKVGDKVLWTRDTFAMTRSQRAGVIADVWDDGEQFRYRIEWQSEMLPTRLGEVTSGSLMVHFDKDGVS